MLILISQGSLLDSQSMLADAQTGNVLADKQLKALSYTLGSADINKAQNESNAADSWWGRNVAPFLPSMLQGSAVGAGVGAGVSSASKLFSRGGYSN